MPMMDYYIFAIIIFDLLFNYIKSNNLNFESIKFTFNLLVV